MKALVIVESPSKARTLAPMLGSAYVVRASMGHVRDLPKDQLGVDIDRDFRPTYHLLRQKSKAIKTLRAALQGADTLFLATDPDREGEAIAWHLLQVLRPRDKRIQRVTFHEITPAAINDAFAHPRTGVDMDLVNAQQARRVLDRLVGYQVSPLLWKTTHGKSAGRVQSVALRLVVDRENEIRRFVPQEYWSIIADLAKTADHAQHFLARLIRIGSVKVGLDQPIHLNTQADAERVIAELEGASYYVAKVRQERKTRKPWPPFTTSTLQQSASARLGMSPAAAMMTAQELYEGVDIGAGKPVGLITYMRTDSTAVAAEAQAEARRMIESTLGANYLPGAAPNYKTKVKNAQEAHEAIRPTDVFRYPNALKPHLTDREYKLYDLIWRRFVASQMAAAVYDVTTVDVHANPVRSDNAGPVYLFRALGRTLLFDGFLRVWAEPPEKDNDEEEPQTLPELAANEQLDLLALLPHQHFTQAPSRYTEATLIKALEDRGIGRPSTYAAIMATLKAREYVLLEKRHLLPTALGEATCEALIVAFPEMMDYGFTAQVEDWLDSVSRGERDWVNALQEFYTPFSKSLVEAEAKMRSVPQRSMPEASPGDGGHDPVKGKRGGTRKAAGSRKRPALVTDVKCPKCGAAMVQRVGSHGAFLGCSRYPGCTGTRGIEAKPAAPNPST